MNIGNIPANSYLAAMDVKLLYTNIPNSERIAAVKSAYDNYLKEKSIATKAITTFLALIITLNNFIFNCKYYLQITEYAKGTICAPAYTNVSWQASNQNIYIPIYKRKIYKVFTVH